MAALSPLSICPEHLQGQGGRTPSKSPYLVASDTKQSFPGQCLTHPMVQFWGPPLPPQFPHLLPSEAGQETAGVLGGRGRDIPPSQHPSPSILHHYPSLGDPTGYPQTSYPIRPQIPARQPCPPNGSLFKSEGPSVSTQSSLQRLDKHWVPGTRQGALGWQEVREGLFSLTLPLLSSLLLLSGWKAGQFIFLPRSFGLIFVSIQPFCILFLG